MQLKYKQHDIGGEVVKDNEVIKYVEQCPNVPASILEQHNKAATK